MKERYAEALLIFVIIMRSTSYLFSKIAGHTAAFGNPRYPFYRGISYFRPYLF